MLKRCLSLRSFAVAEFPALSSVTMKRSPAFWLDLTRVIDAGSEQRSPPPERFAT